MNPLNRKMFRQPGMSRQPAGILASSPELANVVRQRMGQPVQMANGGQSVTNYMSAIKDLAAKGDKATLNNIARDQRLPRSVQMAAANALAGRTVPGQIQTAPAPNADRMAANRANLGALRGRVGQDALTDQAMAQINAANRSSEPSLIDQGIAAANKGMGTVNEFLYGTDTERTPIQTGLRALDTGVRAVTSSAGNLMSGDFMRPVTDYLTTPQLTEEGIRQADIAALTAKDEFGNIPDDGKMPSETLAATATNGSSTFGTPRPVVTTLDPGAQAEADAALPETTIDPATQDPGVRAGVTGTEPSKKVKKKKTAVEAAIDLAESNETADAQAEKTVVGATNSENVNAAIASALETQQSDASDKDKAEATDSILGITAKTRKERVKARQALIKEMLGEDQAKDMRTDANYNLMMLGLLMATGQSSSALANFAEAAKLTLGSYAKVKGERSEAKRKEDRAIALKALDEVGAEISVEEKRMYDNLIRRDEQQFKMDLQEQRDVAALERLDRQLTSAEQRQVEEFKFKRELNNRTFRQNISMLGIKAENAEGLQQLKNDFTLELKELENQQDTTAIKTARAIQASNPTKYPTLADAYAATKATSTSRPTDEQQRYNRLVANGMRPSDALIFAQSGVTTEMFKQLGVEQGQETIGGLMNSGGQAQTSGVKVPSFDTKPSDDTLEALTQAGITQVTIGGKTFNITAK
jgi:hypothetical protein